MTYTITLFRAAVFRAVHTAAQAALAAGISTATVLSDVNWTVVGSTAGMAAAASLVKSLTLGVPEDGVEVER